uniref:Transcription factor Sp2-like n=1 Tax=Nicotiana tabacum TaxID=4097 RepID=A0A1S3XZ98_TOBAC|nr:PREDICTED: transcription factor Sp2-like [Nicotiana tabacum]
MAGYPINVGAVISSNISMIAWQDNSAYPYPNTIIDYLTDAKVETRDFDTKVKEKKPFDWYSMMDTSNPKKKVQPSITTCQSDEPTVVASEAADLPSTYVEPSTSSIAMPPPSSSAPTTTSRVSLKPVPMPTVPLSTLRVSQILASLNNWMQTTTSKMSNLSSTVVVQSTSQAPQVPSDIDETLKKILENQNAIMDTLQKISGQAPEGVRPSPSAPSASVAPAGQSDEPNFAADTVEAVREMFANPATPKFDDDEIQLADPEGDDIAGDTEISKDP